MCAVSRFDLFSVFLTEGWARVGVLKGLNCASLLLVH